MNTVYVDIQKFTSFDMQDYLSRVKNFLDPKNTSKIINYWKNRNSAIDIETFKEFNYLLKQYDLASVEITKYYDSIKTYTIDDFNFLDFISNIKFSLQLIQNIPKYLGVSSNFVDVFEEKVEEYFVTKDDTLESIALKFYGDTTKASKLADYNNLRYYNINDSTWAGRKILVPIDSVNPNFLIPGIIDGQSSITALGKEIKSEFNFANDDIETVEYEDCFQQSISLMISSMPRQSIPENENIGFSPDSVIGKNVGVLSTQIIINDLRSLLTSDPTFSNIKINKAEIVEDSLILSVEVNSILREIVYSDVLPLPI